MARDVVGNVHPTGALTTAKHGSGSASSVNRVPPGSFSKSLLANTLVIAEPGPLVKIEFRGAARPVRCDILRRPPAACEAHSHSGRACEHRVMALWEVRPGVVW